jgi:hypothetical protein
MQQRRRTWRRQERADGAIRRRRRRRDLIHKSLGGIWLDGSVRGGMACSANCDRGGRGGRERQNGQRLLWSSMAPRAEEKGVEQGLAKEGN